MGHVAGWETAEVLIHGCLKGGSWAMLSVHRFLRGTWGRKGLGESSGRKSREGAGLPLGDCF